MAPSNHNDPIVITTAHWKRLYTLIDDFSKRQDCEPFREPVPWKALGLTDYPILIPKPMDLGTIKKRLKNTMTTSTTTTTSQQQQQSSNTNNNNSYISFVQCYEDVRLIWDNCMTYNADGSDFYKLAQALSKRWDTIYNKFITDIGMTAVVAAAGNSTSSTTSSSTTTVTTTTAAAATTITSSGPSSSSSSSSVPVSTQSSNATTTGTTNNNNNMNDRKVTLQEKRTLAKSFYVLTKEDLGKVLIEIEKRCPHAIKRNATEDELDLNMDVLDVTTMKCISDMVNKMKTSSSSGKKKPSHGSHNNNNNSSNNKGGGSTSNGGTITTSSSSNIAGTTKKAKVDPTSSTVPATKTS